MHPFTPQRASQAVRLAGLALLLLPVAAHALPGPHPTHVREFRSTGHPIPQGYLGIDVRGINEDEVSSYHLRDAHGAMILRVDHDGPAGKMGLHERDVILLMNGVVVEGEEHIRHMLRDCPPGHTVTMVVNREGQVLSMQTQMADKTQVDRQAWAQHLAAPQAPPTGLPTGQGDPAGGPTPASAPASRYSRGFLGSLLMSPSYTGAAMETMSPQLAQFFGVPSGAGLLVRSVADNSPAALAGMHAGDVVLRANSHGVLSMADWTRIVKEAKGHPVTVIVLRDRGEHTLTLIPDGKKHAALEKAPEPLAWFRHPSS